MMMFKNISIFHLNLFYLCLFVVCIVVCDGATNDDSNVMFDDSVRQTTVSIRWGGIDDYALFRRNKQQQQRLLQRQLQQLEQVVLNGTVQQDVVQEEDEEEIENNNICNYNGEIVLSHPMSIGVHDKHYVLGSQMLRAAQISVDKINSYPRCGVHIGNDIHYSLLLQTYGDESSKDKVEYIANAIVSQQQPPQQQQQTDFVLAGYSSSLTSKLTPVIQNSSKICITGGSSRTSVHADKEYIFGLNPPSFAYLEYAFKGTSEYGAKTVAYIKEDSANACDGTESMATKYNMTFLLGISIPEESEIDIFENAAYNISLLNPDIVITCVRTRITYWNIALRNINWSPKAQIYTYIIGTPEMEELTDSIDIPYIMGVSSWDRALPPIKDNALNWTPNEFDIEFTKAAFRRPAYQHVQQAAVISVLVQSIERIAERYYNTPNSIIMNFQNITIQNQIRNVLANEFFPTVYGNVSFDMNGQNAVPFLLLQYDFNRTLHVLYPKTHRANPNIEMIYPLPRYDKRDCIYQSDCIVSNGTCTVDGYCHCSLSTTTIDGEIHLLQSNDLVGIDASCIPIIMNDEKELTTIHLLMIIIIPLVVIVTLIFSIVIYYIKLKKKFDSVWQINKNELVFDDPPEIIGCGTFGEVLLAEYRGTKVAIKRVFKPTNTNNNNTTTTSTNNQQRTSVFDPDKSNNSSSNLGMQSNHSVISNNSSHIIRNSLQSMEGTTTSSDEYITTNNKKKKRISDLFLPNKKSGGGGGKLGMATGMATAKFGQQRTLRNDFIKEMRYVSKLRHPCITTVMGAVIHPNEEPMLVMEYMEYGSLSDMLINETLILDGEILVPILQDITQGCRFLHAMTPQIIHGDIKSANILVDSKFRAKVSDFGLSRKKKRFGTVLGTPFFMAPELLRYETTNNAMTDVYAFGILLYEVWSRKEPYEDDIVEHNINPRDILKQISDPEINKRPIIPRNCPPQMTSLITDCIVSNPEERPTFEELDKRLRRIDKNDISTNTRSSFLTVLSSRHLILEDLASSPKNEEQKQQNELVQQNTNTNGGATNGVSATSQKKQFVSLFDIFPKHIAEALRDGKEVKPEHKDCVTIFFSDIIGFTTISSTLEPRKIANMLDRLYRKFDDLSDKHDIFKVETIGDAYMAVTNLVKDQPMDHCKKIAEFAVEAVTAANSTLVDEDDISKGYVNIRVGFHSGPVVADVVGSRNPRYCLFGDTVNTASRMESNSLKNRIQCSEISATILKKQNCKYPIKSRGIIDVKGKGKMKLYWILPTLGLSM